MPETKRLEFSKTRVILTEGEEDASVARALLLAYPDVTNFDIKPTVDVGRVGGNSGFYKSVVTVDAMPSFEPVTDVVLVADHDDPKTSFNAICAQIEKARAEETLTRDWGRPIAPGLKADESLVDFDGLTCAANRPEHVGVLCHRFADAMPNEPAGFEIDTQGAAELVRAETFLAGAHQVHRLEPDVHWHMALLEDGADLHGKGLPAGIALVSADPGGLAFKRPATIHNAAMRTYAAICPYDCLDVGIGGFFIAKPGFVKNGLGHRLSPYRRIYNA